MTKISKGEIVLVESGKSMYIGEIDIDLNFSNDNKIELSKAFKVNEMTALTPEGMLMKMGTSLSTIIPGYEKAMNIQLVINSLVKIDSIVPFYKSYQSMTAKCAGIILAEAGDIDKIKKIII